MIKFLTLLLLFSSKSFSAPLICTLCSVGVASGFGLAKFFNINENIISLWLGACLFLFYQWSIYFLNKYKINNKIINFITLLSSYSILLTFYIGKNPNIIFNQKRFFYIDSFLFFNILGGFLLFLSGKYYQYLKNKNGKPHFQFEKVILPIVILFIFSLLITLFVQ